MKLTPIDEFSELPTDELPICHRCGTNDTRTAVDVNRCWACKDISDVMAEYYRTHYTC